MAENMTETEIEWCHVCGRQCHAGAQFPCTCEDDEDYAPVRASRSSFDVTCQTCSYSGSIERVALHSCAIAESGGRCEDFPCCGHTDGDGCQTLPEHTGEYWSRMMQELGQDRYDELDASGYWDQP